MSDFAAILLNRVLARCSLRHVQLLLMLAQNGSLERTAEAIGVPQASLEQELARLDAVLETELFRSEGSALVPTAACLALLPYARQVMRSVAGAADALVAQRRRERILVRVLATSRSASSLLAHAVPAFQARYARVHVVWSQDDGEDPGCAIARGDVDLVVGRRPAAVPDAWSFRELPTEPFAAVCAPDHPLAGDRQASWGELLGQPWLLPPVGSAARERFDALLARSGRKEVSHCVVTSVDDMTDWLMRDHEVLAFVPTGGLLDLLVAGELVRLRPDPPGREPLGLLQPRCPGEAALRLCGFLEHFASAHHGAEVSDLQA